MYLGLLGGVPVKKTPCTNSDTGTRIQRYTNTHYIYSIHTQTQTSVRLAQFTCQLESLWRKHKCTKTQTQTLGAQLASYRFQLHKHLSIIWNSSPVLCWVICPKEHKLLPNPRSRPLPTVAQSELLQELQVLSSPSPINLSSSCTQVVL